MPYTTANRGYPAPALTDQPNGPAQIQALADSVDADVAKIVAVTYADQSTPVTLTTSAQNLAGVTLNAGRYKITASAQFDWSIASAGRQYTLRLATASAVIGNPTLHIAPLTATSGTAQSTAKTRLSVECLFQVPTDGTAISVQAFMDTTGGTSSVYNGHIEAVVRTF